MSKKVLVFVTHGSEEMELVIVTDILRRAEIEVTLYGIKLEGKALVNCSRGVKIQPDATEATNIQWDSYDALVIPGGAKGSETLSESALVKEKLLDFFTKGKLIASVCAGTLALKSSGINKNTILTSHPLVKEQLINSFRYSEDRVVVDKNVITSRAPGTCFEFSLAIVEKLLGMEAAQKLKPGLLLN